MPVHSPTPISHDLISAPQNDSRAPTPLRPPTGLRGLSLPSPRLGSPALQRLRSIAGAAVEITPSSSVASPYNPYRILDHELKGVGALRSSVIVL
ncbi:hypothetical protein VTO73DRAFT_1657 [Trametes versicolor]